MAKGENGLFVGGFTKRGLLGASIDAMHHMTHWEVVEKIDQTV